MFRIALADVRLSEPLPPEIVRNQFTAYLKTYFFLIPIYSTNADRPGIIWRIGFATPVHLSNSAEIPSKPGLEYLQAEMDKRNPWSARIVIEEVITSSRYRIRAALAEKYWVKVGNANVFLAGDAAHVHSPVAGQGMNVGICDAVSLGNSICKHIEEIKASAADADNILRRYAEERRAIGYRVIGLTKRMTRMVNWGYGWRSVVRNMLLRIIMWFPMFKRAMVWRVSGLANR